MKHQTLWFATILLVSLFFTSCQKEEIVETDPVAQEPTEEEIVELLEVAFNPEASGVTQEAVEAAELSEQYIEKTGESPCGLTFDSLVTYSVDRPNLTADYSAEWFWTVLCDQWEIPETMLLTREAKGSFESLRFMGDDEVTSELQVDNLLIGANLDISGAYLRTGNQTSKVGDQNYFDYTVEMEVEQLLVEKYSWEIVSGTGGFTLTATTSTGSTYTITGTYVITGDQTATITVNGNVYTFEW